MCFEDDLIENLDDAALAITSMAMYLGISIISHT